MDIAVSVAVSLFLLSTNKFFKVRMSTSSLMKIVIYEPVPARHTVTSHFPHNGYNVFVIPI